MARSVAGINNETHMPRKIIYTALLLPLLLGCSQADSKPPLAVITECADPRPQMCTMDYQPVCAQRDTGIRCVTTPCPSSEWKTYSNSCGACSDANVSGYRAGSCDDDRATP
jgi:hypothetical protein